VYLALLTRANPFARYFALAAPFVAALAGAGATALAERLAPRRAGLVATALVVAAVAMPPVRAGSTWRCSDVPTRASSPAAGSTTTSRPGPR